MIMRGLLLEIAMMNALELLQHLMLLKRLLQKQYEKIAILLWHIIRLFLED